MFATFVGGGPKPLALVKISKCLSFSPDQDSNDSVHSDSILALMESPTFPSFINVLKAKFV